MSRFHGKQGKGAMRRTKEQKRDEADARNLLTEPKNRRKARLAK